MFLITSVFFYYLFGGNLETFKSTQETLIAALAIVFSSPIIGVIVSAIGGIILHKKYKYRIWYYIPEKPTIVEYVLGENLSLRDKIIKDGIVIWDDETRKEFYPYYQAQLRHKLNSEQIAFLDRRWSSFWTHVNNITATGFSLVISLILNFKNICGGLDRHFSIEKIVGLVFIVGYCVAGFFIAKISRKDAGRVEHVMFENAILEETRIPPKPKGAKKNGK
jgi:hypothetical protein